MAEHVTPENVKEYRVTVTIRPYSKSGEAREYPDKGGNDYSLCGIVDLEEVREVSLEVATVTTVIQLVHNLKVAGWPVQYEDQVVIERAADGDLAKKTVPGMARTHPTVKRKMKE